MGDGNEGDVSFTLSVAQVKTSKGERTALGHEPKASCGANLVGTTSDSRHGCTRDDFLRRVTSGDRGPREASPVYLRQPTSIPAAKISHSGQFQTHAPQQKTAHYSMTSSARASNLSDTVMPSDFASPVRAFSTGRSGGRPAARL